MGSSPEKEKTSNAQFLEEILDVFTFNYAFATLHFFHGF